MESISIADFEAIQNHRRIGINEFERKMKESHLHRKNTVRTWLCHFDCSGQQESHRGTRSICKDPGRWLLNHSLFQDWLDPDSYSEPFLWLNGKPGAGNTSINIMAVKDS